MITTQKQLRDAFWLDHPGYAPERRSKKRHNAYRTDIRVSFVDWLDNQARNGNVSEKMAQRATL